MSDDLDTLLRDAGRAPTFDLDLDAVRVAGKRRTTTRRAAAGLGTAGLALAILAGGNAVISDRVTPEIAPVQTPGATEEASAGQQSVLPLETLVEEGDGLTATLIDTANGTTFVRTVTPPGTQDADAPWQGGLLQRPVVGDDGTLWVVSTEGELTAHRPDGSGTWEQPGPLLAPSVLGVTESGEALTTDIATGGQPVAADLDVIVRSSPGEDDAPYQGINVADVLGEDSYLVSAAAVPEHMVLVHGAGDRQQIHVLPAGQEPRLIAEATSPVSFFSDAAITGSTGWVVEQGTDGVATLLHFDVWDESPSVSRVVTPVGDAIAGRVASLDASPDGLWLVLNVESEGGVPQAAVVMDVKAAVVAQVVDASTFRRVDQPGLLFLGRYEEVVDTVLPACAQEPEALNQRDHRFAQVWFECSAGWDVLPEGAGFFPFGGAARFTDAPITRDALGLTKLLRDWEQGPTADEQAAGLSGGLGPEVGSIGVVDVSEGAVTVDLIAGPKVGILGTTHAGSSFILQVVGAVLQFDEFATVTITLDGDCAAFAGLREAGDGCLTFNRADTPWGQSAGVCARDRGSINQPAPADGAYVLRWCPDASWVQGLAQEGFTWSPSERELSSPATLPEIKALLLDTLAGASTEESERGLLSGGATGATPAELEDSIEVTLDGARLLIDIDPDIAELMPLTAPMPNYLFETVVAATMTQLPTISEVQLLVGGSCEVYENSMEQTDGAPCRVLTDPFR